jgi:hypothetical protein
LSRCQLFFRALERSLLCTACATIAGSLQRSRSGNGARDTSSGEPNSFNSREASPGVNASANQERDASGSVAQQAHPWSNCYFN